MMESYREQIEYGLKADVPIVNKKSFDNVIVIGMGGSALAGELLRDCYSEKPVIVVRDYSIPDFVNKKSLVFVISYSGNTEETLSAYKDAKKKKAKIIAVTSGGKLGEVNEERVFLQKGLQPRDAVPMIFVILLRILGIKIGKRLGDIAGKIDMGVVEEILGGLKVGRVPVVYGSSEKYRGLVFCWKNLFNEDCKLLCHTGVFSEVNHNELEIKDMERFLFVYLDGEERGRLKLHSEFSEKIFNFRKVSLEGNSLLEKIMYGLVIGNYITKSYAKLKGVDAYSTNRIAELKRFLGK